MIDAPAACADAIYVDALRLDGRPRTTPRACAVIHQLADGPPPVHVRTARSLGTGPSDRSAIAAAQPLASSACSA